MCDGGECKCKGLKDFHVTLKDGTVLVVLADFYETDDQFTLRFYNATDECDEEVATFKGATWKHVVQG
jgi:hypothetical protein